MGTDCKSAAFSFGGSNPPAPTKNSSIRTGYWGFCFAETFSGLGGWIRTASTRRTVRRGKKPLRGFFRCAARAIHPRPPRTPVSEPGTGVSVLSDLKENTVHAAQRSFCRVNQRQNPSAVLRDGKFLWKYFYGFG